MPSVLLSKPAQVRIRRPGSAIGDVGASTSGTAIEVRTGIPGFCGRIRGRRTAALFIGVDEVGRDGGDERGDEHRGHRQRHPAAGQIDRRERSGRGGERVVDAAQPARRIPARRRRRCRARLSASPAPQAIASPWTIVIGRSAARAASWRARICARHQTMADEGGVASVRASAASAAMASATIASISASVGSAFVVGGSLCVTSFTYRCSVAASLRRARNSSSLMLPVLSPRTSAISLCEEPCA